MVLPNSFIEKHILYYRREIVKLMRQTKPAIFALGNS